MHRDLKKLVAVLIVLVLAVGLVSAFSLGDLFDNLYGKITGKDKAMLSPFETKIDHCEGADINGDDAVRQGDLDIILRYWARECNSGNQNCSGGDIDGNGRIGQADMDAVLRNWGMTPCIEIVLMESCGDGIVNYDEVCDGGNRSCFTNGYSGSQNCSVDCAGFGDCVVNEFCGDNIVNGGEECDGGSDCSNNCTEEIVVAAESEISEGLCSGDTNGDGFVGQEDLDIILRYWAKQCNQANQHCEGADSNGDDFIGQVDLDAVNSNWAKSCEAECLQDSDCGEPSETRRYCEGSSLCIATNVPHCNSTAACIVNEQTECAVCVHGCESGACSGIIDLCRGCYYEGSVTELRGICFDSGVRINLPEEKSYCGMDNGIKVQKSNGESCSANFECLSELCSEGVCAEEVILVGNLYLDNVVCSDSDSVIGDVGAQSTVNGFVLQWYNECEDLISSGIGNCDVAVSMTDVCKDSRVLYEMTCKGDAVGKIEYTCSNGCSQGRCVNLR